MIYRNPTLIIGMYMLVISAGRHFHFLNVIDLQTPPFWWHQDILLCVYFRTLIICYKMWLICNSIRQPTVIRHFSPPCMGWTDEDFRDLYEVSCCDRFRAMEYLFSLFSLTGRRRSYNGQTKTQFMVPDTWLRSGRKLLTRKVQTTPY